MHKKLFCRVIAIILLFAIAIPTKALPPTSEPIAVKSISLDKDDLIIGINENVRIIATIGPDNATNKEVIWESSNEDIVTVNQDGQVTGIANGAAIVSVISKSDKDIKASCNITVASISLYPNLRGIKTEDTFTIQPVVIPASLLSEIKWKSSNVNYATVENGTVKGIATGNATITATIENSKVSASIPIKVYSSTQELKSINFSELTLSVHEGIEQQIAYTLNPEYTTQPELIWSSADESKATVNDRGVVKGISSTGNGTVLITATSVHNPDIKNQIPITVLPTIGVTEISNIPQSVTLKMNQGVEVITPTILPANATFPEIKVSSSNKKVARVVSNPSGNGIYHIVPERIDGPNPETAIITFQSISNPNVKAECVVTVEFVPTLVETVILSKSTADLTEGEELNLQATILPKDATDKTVIWTTSDETLATITPDDEDNSKALVKALKPTESNKPVIITVTAKEGTPDSKGQMPKAELNLTIKKKLIPVTEIKITGTIDDTLKLATKEFNGLKTTGQLGILLEPENTTDTEIEWQSSANNIARIDENGLITALNGGIATITARSKNRRQIYATCKVAVYVPVEKLQLNTEYFAIKVDRTQTLQATVSPYNASNKKLAWTSSNNEIAIVNENGVVTGKKEGSATITVQTTDGSNLSASASVLVKAANNIDITSISISPANKTIYQYQSQQLTATIYPQNATIKDIVWTSSDESIATVDRNGLVYGVSGGQVTITATSVSNPSISRSAYITITPILRKIEVISLIPENTELFVGEEYTIPVDIFPSQATNKNLKWTSTNSTVATVSDNGKIKALTPGQTTVIASAQDGSGISDEITFTIKEPEKPTTNQIVISETEVYLETGDTYELNVRVDLVTSGVSKELEWISDNTSVARVTNGIIHAVGEGEALITAQLKEHPEIFATCVVYVEKKVIYIERINLYSTSITLTEGQKYRLNYNYYPSNATDPSFHWVTNNSDVATVLSGEVSAVGKGTAIITVYAMDGSDVSATCEVTVTQPAGINGVNGDEVKIKVDGGSINIEGSGDSTIEVFNMSGALIYSGTEPQIDNLTAGLYIVRIGSYSTKVVVK